MLSICSSFLYLFVLWVFAACFCISLCCEYLQHVCCQTDEDVFLICWCFFYLNVFCEVAARWALSATVPRPYFEIFAPHVHTQPWQRRSRKQVKMTHKHIQTKANMDKLCETKQNQRYSPIKKKQSNLGVRFEPFPLLEFLSTAGKLLRYLCGSCLLPDYNPCF